MRFTPIIAAAFLSLSAQAQTTGMSAWRADLKLLAERIPAAHPNAFYRMKKESWDSAVASIDAKLPTMTRNQAMVAFAQLVALVSDGHTSINPLFDPAMNVHYYPVRFELFDDGLFIRSAAPQYASIVGAKVSRIGRVSAGEAIDATATTIGHENDWWVKAWAPIRLNLAEMLDGLGLVDDMAHLPIVIEKDGQSRTVILQPTGHIEASGHNPLGGYDMHDWVDMRTSAFAPLWLQNPGKPYWSTFVREDSTLYVAYRAVITLDDYPNTTFWRDVFAMSDSLPVKRLVIDLRENGGGNSFYNKQVIKGIVARPKLDNPRSTYVIIGDKTFSAAMNLVQDLEQWTNATFVGMPTGNATTFFGDHNPVILPASGMTVQISTLPWYPADPKDRRQFIAPRMYTPLTSAEYRAGIDPAMRAIVASGSGSTLTQNVAAAINAGDSTGALKLVRAAIQDPLNRFRSPEADINALGYRLIATDRVKGLAVFRLNTIAFPQSANTWDSYGEALLGAGQRDAAIAAYQKALALDPAYPSSVEALQRMGIR